MNTWVSKLVDNDGLVVELDGRVARIVNAVLAHGPAVSTAERGIIRVSWSDGATRVVVETHFDAEAERGKA